MESRDKNGLTEKEFLEQYSPKDYPRPSVATDMVILTVAREKSENYRKLSKSKLQILLIERGGHPYINCWALPGGFVNPDETTEHAAERELEEETGVKDVYLEQLYTFSEPNRDPRMRIISCSYMALIDSEKVTVEAGDDAKQAKWFDISYKLIDKQKITNYNSVMLIEKYKLILQNGEHTLIAEIERKNIITDFSNAIEYSIIKNEGIAFDHAKIMAFAMERLRGKIEYTSIALNLMPKYFTLTELQQVYETILEKPLLKASFRRKVITIVEETEKHTENHGHRPSKLYERKMIL